jgi:hypothetical protein
MLLTVVYSSPSPASWLPANMTGVASAPERLEIFYRPHWGSIVAPRGQ